MEKHAVLPPPCAPCLRGNELLFQVVLTELPRLINCSFQQNSTLADAPESITGEGFYCQNIYLAAVDGPVLTEPHLDMTGTEVGDTQQVEYLV
jgi:hypothetical protein